MLYQVWFMRPEQFRQGLMGYEWCLSSGRLPNVRELEKTHVLVHTLEVPTVFELFVKMQASIWKPDPREMLDFMKQRKVLHTSMCVGDIAVNDSGLVTMCDIIGWKVLGTRDAAVQAGPVARTEPDQSRGAE